MAREIQWDNVRVERDEHGASIMDAQWTALGPKTWSVLRDGIRYRVECVQGPHSDGSMVMRINGVRRLVKVLDARAKLLEKMGMSMDSATTNADVHAPMPGKVLQVLVRPGDEVEEGMPLLVLEAMKMENMIKALSQGKVSEVPVDEGQAVEKGALLVAFED
ncbi:MAG: acetyl-CoA carboxylase biotin carboxyl carrier protein subunit [Bacteroidetes bacterium]|nr:acetyl-CoA carboxylase biotin carboxyl carrier protein subunit [Bacteroidota bacterium]MDA0903699.1 acetyl-CoA carboxylase biotin carboxyl carrier protein subunit [Bacteroidota bacterium]MDA1242481.1 acetyl-CoA carboxylase biotin carboxyl carrier protein subunit [Bacteroidota bacterium]